MKGSGFAAGNLQPLGCGEFTKAVAGEFATHYDASVAENLPEYPSGGELALKSISISSRVTQWGGE